MKRYFHGMLILMSVLLIGCKQKEVPVITEKEERYTIINKNESMEGFTVDDEGYVYMITRDYSSQSSDPAESNFNLHKYHPDGALMESHNINAHYFNGGTDIEDGILYFVANNILTNDGFVIYGYHLETKELKMITTIDNVKNIVNIVVQDKKIFILTNNTESKWVRHTLRDEHMDLDDKLRYYDIQSNKSYELSIENPIQISELGTDRLLILSYYNDKGHCFVEYHIKEETMSIISEYGPNIASGFAISEDEKSILHYSKTRPDMVVETSMSDFSDEIDIFNNQDAFDRFGLLRKGNYLYFTDKNSHIVKLNLDKRKRGNKTIQLLYSVPNDSIYGNGYKIERTWLMPEEFALRVLSGDGSYDICLWSSRMSESLKMKESGSLYPLNKINGIEEYLDSCFPYIREAATNDSGEIWMLPIKVEPQGYLVHLENIQKDNISIKKGMTYLEYAELIRSMPSESKSMFDGATHSMLFNLFMQMKENDIDLDSETFRKIFDEIKNIYPLIKDYNTYPIYVFQHDFYFGYIDQQYAYESMEQQLQIIMDIQGKSDASFYTDKLYQMYPEPQINVEDSNLANCIFLTVNRNSDNLKETIQFLESYVQHMLEREEPPIFYKKLPEGASYLRKSIYEFYENSKIVFNDGIDIYMDNIYKVLEDEMSLDEYIVDTKRKLDMYYNE